MLHAARSHFRNQMVERNDIIGGSMTRTVLFVGEGDHGVVAGGAQGGVDGSSGGTNDSQDSGGEQPGGRDQDREAGVCLLQNGLRQEGEGNAQAGSEQREN